MLLLLKIQMFNAFLVPYKNKLAIDILGPLFQPFSQEC
jgi:hypothetical protein